ncbi:MAG: hypothetical protein Q8O83_03910 [bacterium]|nr:hypothetical protein [bacterium]
MRKKEKGFLFDFGGVLAEFDVDEFYIDNGVLFGATRYEVRDFFESEYALGDKPPMKFWHSIEENEEWTPKKIYTVLSRHFGKSPHFDDFIIAFNKTLRERPLHTALFLSLSRRISEDGYIQGLLSNANCIHAEHMRSRFGHLFKYFHSDIVLFSCEWKGRKSENPAFFNVVLGHIWKECGISREHIMFVDNLSKNTEGFRIAGGNAIEFQIGGGLTHLEKQFEEHGFPVTCG